MKDMIYREDAIDELKKISFSYWFECGEYLSEDTREIKIISSSKALEAIEALPSAQPEAKPPKWVAEDRYVKNIFMVFQHCPQCNAEIITGDCYCRICGQHIDWSEDDG